MRATITLIIATNIWGCWAPDLDGAWFARGGFGTVHLLSDLPWDDMDGRPVLGFSDATALFCAMAVRGIAGAIHAPVLHSLADHVDAASQDANTTQNYTISSGTTLTVDGTSIASDDPNITELFVRDLTIESGGALIIPDGKRLRVMGTFIDLDGNAITGDGCLCVDGTFLISND